MKIGYRFTLLGLLILVLALSGCARSRSASATAPVLAAADPQVAAQGGATISLVTAKPTLNQGEEFKVEVKVSGVQDLYAGDVRLQFDPAKLEVVDANPGVPGVQIEVGKFPDPSSGQGFVAQNLADNAAGRIAYAVTLLSPAKPVSGEGALATVTFKAKAAGPPAVSFLSALLTKQDNSTIQANTAALGAGGAPAGAAAQTPAGATAAPKAAGATPPAQAPTGATPGAQAPAGATAAPKAAGATPPAQAPAGATPRAPGAQAVVSIDPATANIAAVGGTATVNVRVSGVTDLFGADVRLTFNPAFVEVNDADGGQAGVQITPGDCFPSGSQIARNAADNTTGNITFAASRVGQVPGVTGSCTIATIVFRGKAAGSSPVDYQREPQLANNQGVPIPASFTGGTVTVGGGGQPPTVTPGTPRPTVTPGAPPPTATPGPGTGPGRTCAYKVVPGDTLASIALRYGTTISAIANANGISNPNRIRVGQTLTIPNCSGPVQPTPPGGNCFHYTVQHGDTLSSIAARYGTSAAAIAFNNGIVNPHRIRAGQRLIICPGAAAPTPPSSGPCAGPCKAYLVRPGDTLYSIALRHNTTVYDLQRANGLANPNTIYAGQVLNVP